MSQSYQPHPLLLEREIQRLRAQVALTWDQELPVYARLGLRDGLNVLELGSGPGWVTERLLAALPQSAITSLEIDPSLTQRAIARLAPAFAPRWQNVPASVLATGLPADTYDFALARYLLQHLPDPVAAAREIHRVLKPGGTLIVTDVDEGVWGVTAPPIAAFEQVRRAQIARQRDQGGNAEIGRHLWRILRQAGFTDLRHEAVLTHSDMVGLDPFRAMFAPDATMLNLLAQAGLIPPPATRSASAVFEEWVQQPDPFVMVQLFVAAGTK